MATKLIITPQTTSINATSNTTTLTISSAVAGAATDAQGITFNNPVGTLSDESTVEGALNFLANQFFVQTTAPTSRTKTTLKITSCCLLKLMDNSWLVTQVPGQMDWVLLLLTQVLIITVSWQQQPTPRW